MAFDLPERYQDLRDGNGGVRRFAGRELEASDRVLRHVIRGGLAVLEGPWERIVALYEVLQRRCPDRAALRRLMVRAEGDVAPDLEPPQQVPYLAMIVGGNSACGDYLVAVEDLRRALSAQAELHPVEALGASLVVHENVLVPRSQPLIHLLRRAMEQVVPALPPEPAVLDMGCGSGCCALLAAQVFPGASVVATDHLPEAAATTLINRERFERLGLIRPNALTVAQPGDLFQTLGDRTFDLMIFNAPWVAAPARNRAETALNDGGQQTVRRFLVGASARLNQGGRVILGYADHSGEKAVRKVERFMHEAGFIVRHRHADRIKTHRSQRAWQSIFAYELAALDCE